MNENSATLPVPENWDGSIGGFLEFEKNGKVTTPEVRISSKKTYCLDFRIFTESTAYLTITLGTENIWRHRIRTYSKF